MNIHLIKKTLLSCVFLTCSVMSQQTTVKILAINDFHGQITTGQLERGTNRPYGGADVLAAYIQDAYTGFENRTAFLSNGDLIGASQPECALLQDEPAFSMLNYFGSKGIAVVATVGNHELDEGITELRRMIQGGNHVNGPFISNPWEGAKFPLINANITDTATGFPILPPFEIKKIPGTSRSIAFIGVTLKETPSMVSSSGITGLKFIREVDAVNYYVDLLRKFGNIHAFVIMLHQGGSQTAYTGWTDTTRAGPSADIVNLIAGLDNDVDIVCTAHSHGFTNAMVRNQNGRPMLVTQAYAKGTAIADIEATIDNTTGDIVSKRARIVTTYGDAGSGLNTNPAVTSYIENCKKKVEPLTNRIISSSTGSITRDQSAAGESALGDLIADAQRIVMNTDFSFMNPGGIRADLNAGDITWGELYTIQPFNNYMVTMQLTGKQIYALLNQQWLGQPYARMLQISGLTYTWDSTRPVGDRIVEIRKDGIAIDTAAYYSVATNNFLSDGGDNFTTFRNGNVKISGPIDLDVLVQYIQTLPAPITVTRDNRITVIP